MKKKYLLYIVILFVSCEQDEIPIVQHQSGEVRYNQMDMGSDYNKQIFYNLNDNIIISENIKNKWDLAFGSAINQIIINSSTFTQLSELKNSNFQDLISTEDLLWRWDNPKGINHGTAFGDISTTSLYIIDRGYNIDGSSRGYRKLIVDSITVDSYFIRYADLDNSNFNAIEVRKNNSQNFEYLSFDTNNLINIEPNIDEWDLIFTQYTHLFENNNETPAYLVTGVLSNYMNNVLIAKDTINKFQDINIQIIDQYNFSNSQDKIGYDWKMYDFDTQSYTVDLDITYIIKDVSERYFKLHFIDFYNTYGQKGCPTFEIQEL